MERCERRRESAGFWSSGSGPLSPEAALVAVSGSIRPIASFRGTGSPAFPLCVTHQGWYVRGPATLRHVRRTEDGSKMRDVVEDQIPAQLQNPADSDRRQQWCLVLWFASR